MNVGSLPHNPVRNHSVPVDHDIAEVDHTTPIRNECEGDGILFPYIPKRFAYRDEFSLGSGTGFPIRQIGLQRKPIEIRLQSIESLNGVFEQDADFIPHRSPGDWRR